jgi:hypothetical protein
MTETTATTAVFTFDTTHHALWAEDVAREKSIPAEVIPAPPETNSKCDLALQVPRDEADSLESAFRDEGIQFRRWG